MTTKIRIDPEIANLCPKLKDHELAQLEENLKRDGCREPLALWGETLLDGHNRHAICQREKIDFETVVVPGIYSKENAIEWVIRNQLGRRNLTPQERDYLLGKRYAAEKQSHGGQKPSGKSYHSKPQKGVAEVATPSLEPDRTAAKIAEDAGVSERTVRNAEPFALAIDKLTETCGEDAGRAIRDGKSKLSREKVIELAGLPKRSQPKAYRQAVLAAKKPRRPVKQKPAITVPPENGTPSEQPPAVTTGDARGALEAGQRVNSSGYIITDMSAKKKRDADEPPDPIEEIVRLNAAWPLNWMERYAVLLQADSGEAADRRRSNLRGHLSDFRLKLELLSKAAGQRLMENAGAEELRAEGN